MRGVERRKREREKEREKGNVSVSVQSKKLCKQCLYLLQTHLHMSIEILCHAHDSVVTNWTHRFLHTIFSRPFLSVAAASWWVNPLKIRINIVAEACWKTHFLWDQFPISKSRDELFSWIQSSVGIITETSQFILQVLSLRPSLNSQVIKMTAKNNGCCRAETKILINTKYN